MTGLLIAFGFCLLAAFLWTLHRARRRNVMLWLPAFVRRDWAGARESAPPCLVHVIFAVADHFEPAWSGAGPDLQRERVARWTADYPRLAKAFSDADGRGPRHTFFFPAEEYVPEHLDRLADLASAGHGEVEVHLHHDRDTSDGLRRTLRTFVDQLRSHGHLGSDSPGGRPVFAFVHGNWALDNARADGRWCGVNDELRILRECGCYADFTLPSAPSDTQTRRINSIYYATDDPAWPRSHEDGVEAAVGKEPSGDLLLVQGPLTVLWPGGRFGVFPRLETGNLNGGTGMFARRVDAWVSTRVTVAGRPDWVFVKVHTHGCNEANRDVLLGEGARRMHERLCSRYNDGVNFKLHYVTAREMVNIIRAAERGMSGDPGRYRDFAVAPPPCIGSAEASV